MKRIPPIFPIPASNIRKYNIKIVEVISDILVKNKRMPRHRRWTIEEGVNNDGKIRFSNPKKMRNLFRVANVNNGDVHDRNGNRAMTEVKRVCARGMPTKRKREKAGEEEEEVNSCERYMDREAPRSFNKSSC